MSLWSRVRAAVREMVDPSQRRLTPDNFPEAELAQGRAWAVATNALTVSPYWACIQCISEDIGKLPFQVLRRTETGREPDDESRIQKLLDNPRVGMSGGTFRETMQSYACSAGNAYAAIHRDASYRPEWLEILPPDRVQVYVVEGNGGLLYVIRDEDREIGIPGADMLHIRGLGNGLVGLSVAGLAARSVELAAKSEEHAKGYLTNGATLSAVLEHPLKLDEAAAKRLAESWKQFQGARNAGAIPILEEGMKIHPYTMPLRDIQFIELRQFQVVDICRWFRMPPPKIQDLGRATWGNLESLDTQYVRDTLTPWVVRWEQEVQAKLLYQAGRYVRFNLRGLLRGDSQARAEYYSKLFQLGALSPNDIRQLEDMNPLAEGGDRHFVMAGVQDLAAVPAQGAQAVASALARFARKERKAVATYLERGDAGAAAVFYERHAEQMTAEIEILAPGAGSIIAEQYAPGRWLRLRALGVDRVIEESNAAIMKGAFSWRMG